MNALKVESRRYFAALGTHIGLLRKERGMTQSELARALGVSQQAVFAYESGERRISVLLLSKLAAVLHTSVESLIGMAPLKRVPNRRLSPRAARHAQRLRPRAFDFQVIAVVGIARLELDGFLAPQSKGALQFHADANIRIAHLAQFVCKLRRLVLIRHEHSFRNIELAIA